MEFDWIYLPATQYAVTGFALLACLALWLSAKAEIRRVRGMMRTSLEHIASDFSTLSSAVEETRKTPPPPPAVEEATKAAPMVLQMPLRQGLNLTKRSQILLMKRRGENLQNIAAALQLPVGEVGLILKMESLQAAAAGIENSQTESNEPAPMARGAARGIL